MTAGEVALVHTICFTRGDGVSGLFELVCEDVPRIHALLTVVLVGMGEILKCWCMACMSTSRPLPHPKINHTVQVSPSNVFVLPYPHIIEDLNKEAFHADPLRLVRLRGHPVCVVSLCVCVCLFVCMCVSVSVCSCLRLLCTALRACLQIILVCTSHGRVPPRAFGYMRSGYACPGSSLLIPTSAGGQGWGGRN